MAANPTPIPSLTNQVDWKQKAALWVYPADGSSSLSLADFSTPFAQTSLPTHLMQRRVWALPVLAEQTDSTGLDAEWVIEFKLNGNVVGTITQGMGGMFTGTRYIYGFNNLAWARTSPTMTSEVVNTEGVLVACAQNDPGGIVFPVASVVAPIKPIDVVCDCDAVQMRITRWTSQEAAEGKPAVLFLAVLSQQTPGQDL